MSGRVLTAGFPSLGEDTAVKSSETEGGCFTLLILQIRFFFPDGRCVKTVIQILFFFLFRCCKLGVNISFKTATPRVRSICYHLPISDHVYSVIKQQILGASVKCRMNNVALYFPPLSLLQLGDVCGPWDQHAQHVHGCRTPRCCLFFYFFIFFIFF